MISLTVPQTKDDRTLVIDMAADYTEEYLHEHGTLPPSSLLTTDTLTLVIRRNGRPVGALSMATGDDPATNAERSEIDTVYVVPKQRGKGYASAAIVEFAAFAPYPAYLRGPLDDVMEHIAGELEIPTGDHHDLCSLPMVTEAFLNTVTCGHRKVLGPATATACRNCIHTQMRVHFTKTYDLLAASIEGALAR